MTTDIIRCVFLYTFMLLFVTPHFGVTISECLPYLTVLLKKVKTYSPCLDPYGLIQYSVAAEIH